MTSSVESPTTAISTPSPRLAVGKALGGRVPEGQLWIAEAPAEPDRLPVPLGGDVDKPALQVAYHRADRLEVGKQALDALADLGKLRLPSVHLAVRSAILAGVLLVEGCERVVEAALLDRQLQEDGAQLGHQRSGFVEGVGGLTLHRRPMVANRWLHGEGFASIRATHARQACSAPRRRLHWGRSEEGAHRTMPDELRRRRQNDEHPPGAHEDPYTAYHDFDLPAYVGSTTFQKLPLVTDGAALRERRPDVAIVGAPFDDAVSHRPGARFGPRAIRTATYHSGSLNSLQLSIEPFEWLDCVDAGDAPVTPANLERGHEVIRRKVLDVASSGAIPIVLGGDHSITFPSASAVAEAIGTRRLGVVHFDAHADAANSTWGVLRSHGTPMRRLIESGVVEGRNFVQVGLRGYWPPAETIAWMGTQRMRWHLMTEIETRGAEAVVADAIAEALDGPEVIYLSIDIDVLDPGLAPGTGTPEPGGLLTRELLRAVRQVVSVVELVAMDVVEVSPPYDHAEVTALAAHRCVMEALSALAARRRDRGEAANPTRLEADRGGGRKAPAGSGGDGE